MPTTPIPTTPIPTTPIPTTPMPTTPMPTPSAMILSFEGDWVSYKISGYEYGPVKIRATGPYSLYIEGGNIWDNMRVLTVDPTTLSCSLPAKGINNFGTALMYEGKAIKILDNKNYGITLKRSNQFPTVTTPPVTTDPYEGTWSSYINGGNEYGPITILSMGQPNTYYVYGGSFTNDNYRVLTVDPTTLSFSLPLTGINNFGKALMYGGKAIKIIGQQISLNRSNQLPTVTTPPVTTDPYEGTWVSYMDGNSEYGPVTILSTGEPYTYYIYGGSVPNDNYRILKFDINNLSFNLPFQNINIGKPLMYGGKALSIGEESIRLKRSNEKPIFTSSPTTTDPMEGSWVSYNVYGIEYGPVTILSSGQPNTYKIDGPNIPYDPYNELRVLTYDPTTLYCSLPNKSKINFGIALTYKNYGEGGKVMEIVSNEDMPSEITLKRSNNPPLLTPTITDPYQGNWRSYNVYGTEYGPVIIIPTLQNTYYIYGGSVQTIRLRILTFNPQTLYFSLPRFNMDDFGKATVINDKAIKISNDNVYLPVTFTR